MGYKWKAASTEALIEIYRANPCLYDSTSPNYRNGQNQREVLQQMADAVNNVEQRLSRVTTEECLSKCQSLRKQFFREYKKMIKSKSKFWSSPTKDYVSTWSWFESLLFLRNFDYDDADDDDGDIDEEEVELEKMEDGKEAVEEVEDGEEHEDNVNKEQDVNKKGDDIMKLP